MSEIEERLKEQVKGTKERLEGKENPSEATEEVLDVELKVGLDGKVRNITMITATGGPHVEVDLGNGMVKGYWGSNEFREPLNENTSEVFWDYYKELWENTR